MWANFLNNVTMAGNKQGLKRLVTKTVFAFTKVSTNSLWDDFSDFFIKMFFFVSALLRDCSMCWDHWSSTWHLHLTGPCFMIQILFIKTHLLLMSCLVSSVFLFNYSVYVLCLILSSNYSSSCHPFWVSSHVHLRLQAFRICASTQVIDGTPNRARDWTLNSWPLVQTMH